MFSNPGSPPRSFVFSQASTDHEVVSLRFRNSIVDPCMSGVGLRGVLAQRLE